MRFLLTAKLLIEADALADLEPGALEHLDAAARIGFGTFLRPRFNGGISLSTESTLDPADGTGDHEFPITERDWLQAEHVYARSLEQARELGANRPAEAATARTDRRASVLITATLPMDTDSPEAVAGEIKPTDDAIRLMFYRSLQPMLEGDSSLSTLIMLDPDDADAEAEFRHREWGERVSRLSVSAHALQKLSQPPA